MKVNTGYLDIMIGIDKLTGQPNRRLDPVIPILPHERRRPKLSNVERSKQTVMMVPRKGLGK